MDLGLRGKAALVTAASKGMGKACALGLAAEGARVAMCARTEADLRAAADEVRAKTGAEVLAVTADVTRAAEVSALTARVVEAFGSVDVLVANAGGPPRGNFEDADDAKWLAAFEITIQSVSVKQPVDGLLLSNGVRPAVAGLVKTLAGDLGCDNILINTVCPGRIMTDRFLSGAAQAGLAREDYVARTSEDVPLRRIGTPEEFANVVVFLASERASYVTGVALQVDGGLVRGIL
jgi:3-oxoacyl-[acyl-carrier protein] reductase